MDLEQVGRSLNMDGVERFQKALIKAGKPYILSPIKKDIKGFTEVFRNYLLDLDGPTELSRKHTGREIHFRKLFDGFTEITSSLDTLEDIAFFIGRFPYQNSRISRERYIQFHVEAYLSEMYLLQQRLERYVTMLERQYKGDNKLALIHVQMREFLRIINAGLRNVLQVRHSHVHKIRFKDIGIRRLGTIGLVMNEVNGDLGHLLRGYYREEHARIRRFWKKKIVENNKAVRQMLDAFFKRLYPIIFNHKTGKFNFPSRLKF